MAARGPHLPRGTRPVASRGARGAGGQGPPKAGRAGRWQGRRHGGAGRAHRGEQPTVLSRELAASGGGPGHTRPAWRVTVLLPLPGHQGVTRAPSPVCPATSFSVPHPGQGPTACHSGHHESRAPAAGDSRDADLEEVVLDELLAEHDDAELDAQLHEAAARGTLRQAGRDGTAGQLSQRHREEARLAWST